MQQGCALFSSLCFSFSVYIFFIPSALSLASFCVSAATLIIYNVCVALISQYRIVPWQRARSHNGRICWVTNTTFSIVIKCWFFWEFLSAQRDDKAQRLLFKSFESVKWNLMGLDFKVLPSHSEITPIILPLSHILLPSPLTHFPSRRSLAVPPVCLLHLTHTHTI